MNTINETIRRAAGLALAALIFCAAIVCAQAPAGKIPYQGRLTDANNQPLTGNYSIRFSIWDTGPGAGGTEIWNETQSVDADRGLISVNLGDGTPINGKLFDDATTYLEVKVGLDPAMTPRIRLLPAPYAFNSQTLNGFDFTALVSTFAAQEIVGAKAFLEDMTVASITVLGTITSTNVINVKFNASSVTLQGNAVDISTVASGLNSLLMATANPSSATLQGNNVVISTVAQGVDNLYAGRINASSYTLQGNLLRISTVAQGVDNLYAGRINASSYTLQGNSVNISTVAQGVDKLYAGSINASSYTLQGNSVNISTVAQGVNALFQGQVNASSYTLYGPIRSRSIIGIWARLNLAANLTDSQMLLVPLDASNASVANNSRFKMPFDGIVRGVIASGSAARTAGSATFGVYKNAVHMTSSDANIDATNTQWVASSAGNETFVAGDILDIRITSTSNWAPTNAEWYAQIVVEWTE